MKTLFLSDIHVDLHFSDAVSKERIKMDDPDADVTVDTMDFVWKTYGIPETDAVILAGDYSNDFLTFSRIIPWLSAKYSQVVLVPGNHDAVVRGSTPSKSNIRFNTTEEKFAEMKALCDTFANVHFLEGNGYELGPDYLVCGCMGFCDFLCEPPIYCIPELKWRYHWFDGKYMKYMGQDPAAIWNHYDGIMSELVAKKPKVMVTHFVPYELGVPFEFRNDSFNYVFYFKAKKYLEEMENDTYWLCGHVHGRRMADYVNSKGNVIHIRCNPLGYPGERSADCEFLDYTGDSLTRSINTVTDNDFVVEC